jgi:pyrroloquinoline quinone (PQQ) biosynthesis protein C
VEHFKSPFNTEDLTSARAKENRAFLEELLHRARGHRFFSHAFLSMADDSPPSREVVAFILTSFYQVVVPFTGFLCELGGHAPNLRSRFALMDNIYEEMGCGDLNAAHPRLYLKMLASIGVSEDMAESVPGLPSIRRINDHLREVVGRSPFSVASAVLASAEATIPRSFPVLARVARKAFREVDMTFFDRHGARDEGHSEDASMLFIVNADPSHFARVEADIQRDLDHRTELFDDWMGAVAVGRVPRRYDRRTLRSGAFLSALGAPPRTSRAVTRGRR